MYNHYRKKIHCHYNYSPNTVSKVNVSTVWTSPSCNISLPFQLKSNLFYQKRTSYKTTDARKKFSPKNNCQETRETAKISALSNRLRLTVECNNFGQLYWRLLLKHLLTQRFSSWALTTILSLLPPVAHVKTLIASWSHIIARFPLMVLGNL